MVVRYRRARRTDQVFTFVRIDDSGVVHNTYVAHGATDGLTSRWVEGEDAGRVTCLECLSEAGP